MKRFISTPAALLVLHGMAAPFMPAATAVGALTAFTLLPTSASAKASINPYGRGYHSPSELADAIKASLATDPSGKSVVNMARCRQDGSCASPDDYLVTLRKFHPDANLVSWDDLDRKLRSLQIKDAPVGSYWMAGLKLSSASKTHWAPAFHGLERIFNPDEPAWVDETGKPWFAQDCSNPVEKPAVKEVCAEIDLVVTAGFKAERGMPFGPTDLMDSKTCTPAVMRPGETHWESQVGECPIIWCDYMEIKKRLQRAGWPVLPEQSMKTKPGVYRFRRPLIVTEQNSPYVDVFCVDATLDTAQDMVAPLAELRAEYAGIRSRFGFIVGGDNYNPRALPYDVVMTYNAEAQPYDAKALAFNTKARAWNAAHSCGHEVKSSDYKRQPDGTMVATVTPDMFRFDRQNCYGPGQTGE